MDEVIGQELEQSPEEKLQALFSLKAKLEDDFVAIGQLLSEVKRKGLYKIKGYNKFKDFIEQEYNIAGTFASKLISIYDLFVDELDIDESSLKNIGVDKLNMIKPLVKNKTYSESEEWLNKANELSATDLREDIKEVRKQTQSKSMKEVLIDQFYETMVTFFNCSRKELNYKLAIYFQDTDLEQVKNEIKIKQRNYEKESEGEGPGIS